jgi:hypothetical protein
MSARWVLAMALGTAIAHPARAAQAQDTPHSAPASAAATGAQRAVLRGLVADALLKVAQARAALRANDRDQVLRRLSEVKTLFDLIGAYRPHGTFLDLVQFLRTHMEYENNDEILTEIAPLYRALNELPATPAAAKARALLKGAEAALGKADRAKAISALDEAAQTMRVNGIELPLKAARDELHSALSAASAGHMPKDETLMGLEQHLVQLLSGTDANTESNRAS